MQMHRDVRRGSLLGSGPSLKVMGLSSVSCSVISGESD